MISGFHAGFEMKTTVKWLKEYVDFDLSAAELGEMLTMAGLEVESISRLAPDGVVAARVEDIRPHPDADRLSLCSVTDGKEVHDVVCGASNMEKGNIVVLALPGAALPKTGAFPDGITIKRAKIRGCDSAGMLCSEYELGISSAKSDGIMILPGSVPAGTPLSDIPGIEDVVIEIAVTPNRPDCLSVIGIAREIAVAVGGAMKIPPVLQNCGLQNNKAGKSEPQTGDAPFSVTIENEDACPLYCCGLVSGVEVKQSPLWLRARLSACGIKPVNNVVDVTNLVLLEFGQPLHAFDCDLINGGRLIVRNAAEAESLKALDSGVYNLKPEDLVIADSGGPVAIAGIIGGEPSSVSNATENVLLEAACFSPPVIRRTSKRLKLSSESSYRFERGVDPAAAPAALKRAASLINSVAGGSGMGAITKVCPVEIKPRKVEISLEKTRRVLGIGSDKRETERLLTSLGFEILESGEDVLTLKVPTFRPDVSRPADVIEEIARLMGYNAIPEIEPSFGMVAQRPDPNVGMESLVKNIFLLNGFSEAVNYGFDSPGILQEFDSGDTFEVLNPISSELSAMRCTLLAGLIRNVKLNLSRQCPDVRLFESGKVFFRRGNGQLPREEKFFAAVAAGDGAPDLWGGGGFDFFDMKGLFEKVPGIFPGGGDSLSAAVVFRSGSDKKYFHPGKSARIVFENGTEDAVGLGDIGEIHPETARRLDTESITALELNLEKLYFCLSGGEPVFSSLPKFPSVRRDVAFVVEKDLEIGSIISGIKDVSPLVEKVWVFDLFEDESIGDNMKSVGISMFLRSAEKTLTDEEANSVREQAVRAIGSSFGARAR